MSEKSGIPIMIGELPQHRVYKVVALPERPAEFDSDVGHGIWPIDGSPKFGLASATFLCQVEWAWTPAHNRVDAYYLYAGSSEWSLWNRYWDDNWDQWMESCYGTVHRSDANEYQAAVHLLVDFWSYDAKEGCLDPFHWIDKEGYLATAELAAIARLVWE